MSEKKQILGWFPRQSIRTKLHFVFGTLGLLAAVGMIVVTVGIMRVQSNNEEYTQLLGAHASLAEAVELFGHAEIEIGEAIDAEDAAELARAQGDIGNARNAMQLAADAVRGADPEVAESAANLHEAMTRFDNALLTLAPQLGDSDGRELAVAAVFEQQNMVEDRIVDSLVSLDAAITEKQTSGSSEFQRLMISLTILGLVALGIVAAAFTIVRTSVTLPLNRITQATRKLVDGEKDVEIPSTDQEHEVGELARALAVFKDNMAEVERLQIAAAEDASAKLRVQEEREAAREGAHQQRAALLIDLVDRFERTVGDVVDGVASASGELQETASSMATTAEQSALQAGEVSNALTEASSGVTAAAAASDEFAMSIGEISRQASTSADLARTAANNASDADQTISALSSAAGQIGQIVELISSIAQRTNLLALNASIEAARGGEAGRGFAVVASEVKDLAAQTSKATDEVADQIRTIQESTAASVTALRTIGDHVGQLESTSISIAAAVDQQSVAGQDLARSIDMAARNTDDVSTNINEVREGTVATGAAATQVLSSSSELQSQAGSLKDQAQKFLAEVRAA